MNEIKLFEKLGSFAEDKDIARDIRIKKILPALESGQEITLDFDKITSATQSFIHALMAVYNEHRLVWAPQSFRSHSDANQLWASGVRPILLGPGRLDKAHAPDESVSFRQVCLSAEIYLHFLMKMFT